MERYIDGNKVWDKICDIDIYSEEAREVKEKAIRIIVNMLPADVQEVKHARWAFVDGHITCTICKSQPYKDHSRIDFSNLYKYCPYCGAKMYE